MEQRVGFGPRLGAWLLDCVIVFVLAFFGGGTIGGLIGVTAGAAIGGAMATQADSMAAASAALGGLFGGLVAFFIAAAVIGMVYFLIEGFTGYTLGKLILGIRVASDDGTAAGLGKLLTRFAIKNCNFLLTVLAALSGVTALRTLGNLCGLLILVGCFFVLGMRKQAFHDMLAHTAVYPKGAIK
jgi:uncharacterized RDD family membrane protein YckC